MPLTNIKIRKKTNTQTNSYTGVDGEVTIDTDKKVIVIHDGSTAGGFPLALQSQANAAGSYANSAYAAANNATDTWVRNAANAAGSYANSAYSKANSISAGITFTANSGVPTTANVGDQWWSTTDDILYEYINDGTSNVWLDISSSAITSTAAASSSSTNNARSMINSYVFGS
jgi:hypothetical protein